MGLPKCGRVRGRKWLVTEQLYEQIMHELLAEKKKEKLRVYIYNPVYSLEVSLDTGETFYVFRD